MFCHLFRLSERTGIQLHEFEQCTTDCALSNGKNVCLIAEQKMGGLTKEKYNWIIETTIIFDPPKISKTGNTSYLAAICLIHPAHNDMWVIYSSRHSKVDDSWTPEFRLYFGTEMKEFLKIQDLNSYLKKNGYAGRKLLLTDFTKDQKDEETKETN